MKALSLWQPWAQLVALGVKRYETRSWSTQHRGPLLVHAARRRPPMDMNPELAELFGELALRGWPREALPRGAIVGLVLVKAVHRTEDLEPLLSRVGVHELARGNFAPGRYAWELERVAAFQPVHMRGFQGLFDVPAWLEPARLEDQGPRFTARFEGTAAP